MGIVKENEPLSKYTSWKVGGVADRFFQPENLEDLAVFLRQLPAKEPIFWMGLGSNLLVRDGGIQGTVIVPTGGLNQIEQISETEIRAEAGVMSPKLARFADRAGLSGLEFLGGIPGTVGGALAMNAGAFGSETWQHVIAVETVDRLGNHRIRKPEEYEIGYRSVRQKSNSKNEVEAEEWFVAATFQLSRLSKKPLNDAVKIRDLLQKRKQAQPIGEPSCGSVFRNPPNDFAGRLIEMCGLKGFCIGGACVSEKHANFITHQGDATATEIEQLILHIQKTVEEQQGIRLIPEVKIVGEQVRELPVGEEL